MRYKVAEDSRPQMLLLLLATAVSIGLWLVSRYAFPSLNYLVYPLQLFATFIHEGSHVLATVLTGNTVQSLTVSPDTSGVVWSQSSGWFSQLLISSAGYLGTTAFGTLLLVWMRYNYSSKTALHFASAFVGMMTIVFGLLMPIWNVFSLQITFGSIVFTVLSGAVLSAGLFAIARYADTKWLNFSLAFLAVQCLLNALFSLVDLFIISTTTRSDARSDALNMANATGIPSIVWVLIWMVISILMISIGLRLYAVSQKKANHDLPFED